MSDESGTTVPIHTRVNTPSVPQAGLAQRLMASDPVLAWLGKHFASPVQAFAALCGVDGVLCVALIAYYRHSLAGNAGVRSIWCVGEALQIATILFLGCPAILAVHLWLPRCLESLTDRLIHNGVVPRSTDQGGQVPMLANDLEKAVGRRVWSWMALVVAILYCIWLMTSDLLNESIMTQPGVKWPSFVYSLLFWYLFVLFALRSAATVDSMNRFFRRPEIQQGLYVDPLHPDRGGGLASVGGLSIGFGKAALVGGWMAISGFLSRHIPLAFDGNASTCLADVSSFNELVYTGAATMLFVVLTLIVVSWPLRSAHQAMVGYRTRMQNWVAAEANDLLHVISAGRSSSDEIADGLEKLQRLGQIQESFIERLPTWPVRPASVRKFSLSTFVYPLMWVAYVIYQQSR